jgi:hypothetical protein
VRQAVVEVASEPKRCCPDNIDPTANVTAVVSDVSSDARTNVVGRCRVIAA